MGKSVVYPFIPARITESAGMEALAGLGVNSEPRARKWMNATTPLLTGITRAPRPNTHPKYFAL